MQDLKYIRGFTGDIGTAWKGVTLSLTLLNPTVLH